MHGARPAPLLLDSERVEALCGGRWQGEARSVTIRGGCIDSRRAEPDCAFFCFAGERVDGHDFAADAMAAGAALVVASRPLELAVPVLQVDDVGAALRALAGEFRQRYQDACWIGVTGSNGKTTVTALIASALGGDEVVHRTPGNYNNELGLPLTILATPADRRYVVCELGANHPGEIRSIAQLLRPRIGVISAIGPAHLEGFGSLHGVAQGKCELFEETDSEGRVLFNRWGLDQACADQGVRSEELLAIVREAAGDRLLTVIGDPGCPIDGDLKPQGAVLRTPVGEVGLRVVGAHNLGNACLAWHVAVAAGADAREALGSLAGVRPVSGRLQLRQFGDHRILDDSYNANPASVRAGLAVLAEQHGARLAVLGSMGELGAESDELHHAIGAEAARLGLPLITVGVDARCIADGFREAGGRDCTHADDHDAAVALLRERLAAAPTAVLVKASRTARLERVVQGLANALGYGNGGEQS